MTEPFWSLQARDFINFVILLVTVAAIIWGPVKAVELTRKDQEAIENERRKRMIFHDLMKYRRLQTQPERVHALNLVHLEFYETDKVIEAYKKYMDHLWIDAPSDPSSYRKHADKRDELYCDLLACIAQSLGLIFDKLELQRLSYSPQGWVDEMDEIQRFRKLMIELLSGKRGLPITDYKQQSPFPPAPN